MSKAIPISRRRAMQAAAATAAVAAAGTAAVPARAAAPFFKLYMMIPNSQPARMIWGTLAARQMTRIGIDVVSSFVPFTVISPRRNKGDGKTYVDGGWDCYLERYYYSSIKPTPNSLFESKLVPPAGQNFYYVEDKQLDAAMETYAASIDPAKQMDAIHAFEKRWYDIQPMTILFYPQDVIAVNPKLTGYDATTFNPTFFPMPENWTIQGATGAATSAFASWPPPSSLIPMYTIGYHESNIFGPVYNRLYEYDSWEKKNLVPALAESHTQSADGKTWVVTLRQGVKWHSGEEFTAADVKWTFDTILDPAYGSPFRGTMQDILGGKDGCKQTGRYQVTFNLPAYNILFLNMLMGAMAIMPMHAYKDIRPESLRGHVASNWLGSYTVKTSDGKTYTAHGGIGTGPWVAQGFDPSRKSYRMTKNPDFWRKTQGNIETFCVVNIEGTDSVLSALKSGDIDAHDPMYDIGSLVSTIDKSWGSVHSFDSYKWQHICYNLRHPVFGTGVDTPLGRQDPSRAAEAAAYIRQAISHAMPREQIVKGIAAGYGWPGTVAMPWSAPEYDHETLKPIAYDLDLAMQYMRKAGYTY